MSFNVNNKYLYPIINRETKNVMISINNINPVDAKFFITQCIFCHIVGQPQLVKDDQLVKNAIDYSECYLSNLNNIY